MSTQNKQRLVSYNRTEEVPINCTNTLTQMMKDHAQIYSVPSLELCSVLLSLSSHWHLSNGVQNVSNSDNFVKSNFPTDSDGNLCGVDAPGYPFVYFANPPEIVLNILFRKEESVYRDVQDLMMTLLNVLWPKILDVDSMIILDTKFKNIRPILMMVHKLWYRSYWPILPSLRWWS